VLAQHRRRAFVRRWVPGASVERVDDSERPAELAARQQSIHRVQALLERLPESAREVLVLCDLEERTEAEVAELLGVPKGTIKSRLHRARAKLRVEAERAGVVPSTLWVLDGGSHDR
jgi:RNA polymerase sigma-70 factor (ECF subfamily)